MNDLKVLEKVAKQYGLGLKEKDQTEWWQQPSNCLVYSAPNEKKEKIEMLFLQEPETAINYQFLGELENLRDLRLWNCNLEELNDLPIQYLSSLTQLNLRSNQLSDIAPIQHLSSLTLLDLSDNQLSDIAPIQHLSSLTQLHLSGNQLSDIAPIEELEALEALYIANNPVAFVPKALVEQFKFFDLSGRPFLTPNTLGLSPDDLVSPPPEVFEQGKEALKAYFETVGDHVFLDELKIVVLGNGAAGKTSLIKRLRGFPFDEKEEQTHGIEISEFEIRVNGRTLKPRIWDFGGQELMHATHRFFLSRRSLFVIVLDSRHDNEEAAEQWLGHVKTYGGNSPALILMNKWEDNPTFGFNETQLRRKYPKILQAVLRTSAKNDPDHLPAVREAIEAAIPKVPLFGSQVPESWKRAIQQLADDQAPFLDHALFCDICTDVGIPYERQQEVLTGFLHDIGVAIHYDAMDMNETYVLNPEWATQGVYRLLNHPDLAESHGVLTCKTKVLDGMLREPVYPDQKKKPEYLARFKYPKQKHGFLIKLMKQFELCFQIEGKEAVLVPSTLPKNQPDFSFPYQEALQFRVQYKTFLPPMVMPRMIVKRHTELEHRWRGGMVCKSTTLSARAAVIEDKANKQINLWVEGSGSRDYLSVLRDGLFQIHDGMNKEDMEELIGCNCETCKNLPDPSFHEYKALLKFYVNGHKQWPCKESGDFIDIARILDPMIPGGHSTLDEIIERLSRIELSLMDTSTDWDAFKKFVSLKVGVGPLKVDLLELLEKWVGSREKRRHG